MAGKNFGITLRDLEEEKAPPLWKIVLGAAALACGFYLFYIEMAALPILFPGLFR